MSDRFREIGRRRPLVPPPGCPAVWQGGVENLWAADFAIYCDESSWEFVDDEGKDLILTEVALHAVFSRKPNDVERVVESDSLLVQVGDPLIEAAKAVQADADRREAVRRGLCELVINCPGVYMGEDGFLACGALTAEAFKNLLEHP